MALGLRGRYMCWDTLALKNKLTLMFSIHLSLTLMAFFNTLIKKDIMDVRNINVLMGEN
jgi:hypothetical protein